MNCNIHIAKTKALISFASLFSHNAESRFSHDAAQMVNPTEVSGEVGAIHNYKHI